MSALLIAAWVLIIPPSEYVNSAVPTAAAIYFHTREACIDAMNIIHRKRKDAFCAPTGAP